MTFIKGLSVALAGFLTGIFFALVASVFSKKAISVFAPVTNDTIAVRPKKFRYRPFWFLTACVILATLSGAISAFWAGDGFKPASLNPGQTTERVEALRWPMALRSYNSISSFSIAIDDVDDFSRVYVNNHIVITNDTPEFMFDSTNGPELARNNMRQHARQRKNPGAAADIKKYLRPGLNVILFELENSYYGGCYARLNIKVGGIDLEGFPRFMPRPYQSDLTIIPKDLEERFDLFKPGIMKADQVNLISGRTSLPPEFLPSKYDSTVCVRHTFTFTLSDD